jgi:ankyrin repeat protein
LEFWTLGACEGGHLPIVQLMIDKDAVWWDGGLESACRGGHISIAQLMIEKGACMWNVGLESARKGGHLDLVLLMIQKGATNLETSNEYPKNVNKFLNQQRTKLQS